MILDDLAHAEQYRGLGPGFDRALRYLRTTNLGALETGRHDIDGDNVFALVSDYETKPRQACAWEAHRRHADVQYVHTGTEQMGVAALPTLAAGPYDEEKDVLFAKGSGEFFALRPNRFVILFPHDAHMPGVSAAEPATVRKIVIKVRLTVTSRSAVP